MHDAAHDRNHEAPGRLGLGRGEALERLLPLIYDELRRIAGSEMRLERKEHTWQGMGTKHNESAMG